MITITNLVSDCGFENSAWSGATYSTTEKHSGTRSLHLPANTTSVPTLTVGVTPIVGHKYYASRWVKSNGENSPADCRWEWFAGDGDGLNFIFGWNRGYYPDWSFQSVVYTINTVNGSGHYIRCFVVNSTHDFYVDDMVLVDLTESFGAGNEPSQAWCDRNIPFFSGSTTVDNPLSMRVKVSGEWKEANKMYVKNEGTWKEVIGIKSKVGGAWL